MNCSARYAFTPPQPPKDSYSVSCFLIPCSWIVFKVFSHYLTYLLHDTTGIATGGTSLTTTFWTHTKPKHIEGGFYTLQICCGILDRIQGLTWLPVITTGSMMERNMLQMPSGMYNSSSFQTTFPFSVSEISQGSPWAWPVTQWNKRKLLLTSKALGTRPCTNSCWSTGKGRGCVWETRLLMQCWGTRLQFVFILFLYVLVLTYLIQAEMEREHKESWSPALDSHR